MFIVWLVSAVFYHLPSLDSMGFNARADLSLLIVVFLATVVVRSDQFRWGTVALIVLRGIQGYLNPSIS